MELLDNPDVQELVMSIAALLASIAFAALKGTEIYKSTISGREDKILKYVEIGARVTYAAYVRGIKKKRGKLNSTEAAAAREIAIRAAHNEAKANGDQKLLAKLSDEELNATLESVLQEIKAGAAMGEGARTSTRPMPNMNTLNGLLFCLLLLPVTLGGCARLNINLDSKPPVENPDHTTITINPGEVERAAIAAWKEWDAHGVSGALPDVTPVTEDQDRMQAYRNAQALTIYAVAQIRSRRPVPDLATTIAEAGHCVSWYLKEAFPHLDLSWNRLYSDYRASNPVPDHLAPLFEWQPPK